MDLSLLLLLLVLVHVPAADTSLRQGQPASSAGQRLKRSSSNPNILFILADDLGWNDIGWNNPDVITTNLDKLAYDGVILNQSYVQPACTPTRAAFMTGRFPFRLGMQQAVVRHGAADYLPLEYTLLPEKLKELGYSTYLVGKWHLGNCREEALPTRRGFDSFLGCWSGGVDYYNKTTGEAPPGYDLWLGQEILPSSDDVYITDLFTEAAVDFIKDHDTTKPMYMSLHYTAPHTPLQVPDEYLALYPNVTDPLRQTYLGMVTAMDEGIGDVIQALKNKGIYRDTIIVFTSDNGGMQGRGGASNHPLRGRKTQLWEGGTRSPTFVYSERHISNPGSVSEALFHVVDWMPTLLSAAGDRAGDKERDGMDEEEEEKIDGINQWAMISRGARGERQSFVYNLYQDSYTALRFGRMKMIEGNAEGILGRLERSSSNTDTATDLESELREMLEDADLDLDLEDILDVANVDQSGDSDSDFSADEIVDLLSTLEPSSPSGELVCDCQLFDVKDDPSETTDLASQNPALVKFLYYVLQQFKKDEAPLVLELPGVVVPESNPDLNGGFISTGWC